MANKTALRHLLLAAKVVSGMAAGVTQADAALTLTAAGIADGHSLSTFTSTPESATVSILAGGLLALAGLRRRKR